LLNVLGQAHLPEDGRGIQFASFGIAEVLFERGN